MRATRRPWAVSLAAWSSMSAMSGLTTSAVPPRGDGGELVAERLAGAGGHDQQHVAAVDGGAADGFLVGAEGGEAEGAVEQVSKEH
jgi:hypothetical protein